MNFENSIAEIAKQDIEGVLEARVLYGDSWRAEGGFSAFFNVKRKIDRMLKLIARGTETIAGKKLPGAGAPFIRERYDLFGHIQADVITGGEAMLDVVRDLRRYLLLVEAYMLETGAELPPARDNIAYQKKVKSGEAQSVHVSLPGKIPERETEEYR